MSARFSRPSLLVLGIVVCLATVACGSSRTSSAAPGHTGSPTGSNLPQAVSNGSSSTPVPSNIQQTVRDDYGRNGFIPSQVASGYGFETFDAQGAGGYNIYFTTGTGEQLQFGVIVGACEPTADAMHTFQENGEAVAWSATEEDQQAWRCVTVNGTQIMIQASSSVPGDLALDTPSQLQDALKLVDLVAYAQLAQ